jgi:hypothetical protein
MKLIRKISFSIVLLAVLSQKTNASEYWTETIHFQASVMEYHDADSKQKSTNYGMLYSAEYLEDYSFMLGINKIQIGLQGSSENIDQYAYYASFKKYFTPDFLPGRLTMRIDSYDVSNSDGSTVTNDVSVFSSQFGYMGFNKSIYYDFGYTKSSYSQQLIVDQLTPIIGFMFNQGNNWLQLRGYLISSSDSLLSQGLEKTEALEVKLIRFYASTKSMSLEKLYVTAVTGERIYAVDMDSVSVANMSDIQESSLSLGGQWDGRDGWKLNVFSGVEQYFNNNDGDTYKGSYAYLNLTKQW